MTQSLTGLVKRDQVRISGTRLVDRDWQSVEPSSPGQGPPPPRIVENKDGVIVVEITCECGKKTYLHCDCRGS